MRAVLILLFGVLAVTGCNDGHHDVTAPDVEPAAPRGLASVTGSHEVFLSWLPNTEADVTGYRIYIGTCPDGPSCPYDFVAQTANSNFRLDALTNGETRYFAISAVDQGGHESDLSYDTIFDTPRPEGFGLALSNADVDTAHCAYDFSEFSVVSYSSIQADVFYASDGPTLLMVSPWLGTEIQDAGYATSLDAVDYAPTAGWSPTGTVELIVGHCYIVWINDGEEHYAKFRVVGLTGSTVTLDWAYQVDPGNRELAVPGHRGPRVRRPGIDALGRHGA